MALPGQAGLGPAPRARDDAAKHKPIGMAPHGALAERLYREKKLNVLTDLLKRIRNQGVLVGLSAHNPALIELARRRLGRGLLHVLSLLPDASS